MTPQHGNDPMASTEPIGQIPQAESTPLQESTHTCLIDLKLSHPRPLSVGPANRSPTIVSEPARSVIRDVCTGVKPWPLTLWGGVGSGKSCAALCVLDRCIFSRRYYTVSEFCERARLADRGELEGMSITGFWDYWRNADITCLDELGSRSNREKVSDHHYDTVKRAIDTRHRQPAIWISNLSLEELAQVYDDRIASRLSEGTVVAMNGKDRRLNK
jgi:DNA replication protein DnaC